MTYTVTQVATS